MDLKRPVQQLEDVQTMELGVGLTLSAQVPILVNTTLYLHNACSGDHEFPVLLDTRRVLNIL